MGRTHEEFVNILSKINPNIEVLGTYTKAQERIAVKCKECGYEWNPKAYYLTQGISCRFCSKKVIFAEDMSVCNTEVFHKFLFIIVSY